MKQNIVSPQAMIVGEGAYAVNELHLSIEDASESRICLFTVMPPEHNSMSAGSCRIM